MLFNILAQAVAAVAAPAPVASTLPVMPPAAEGVTHYAPAFFAEQNPNSAQEMVSRLPGFSFDSGSNVRGFEGAAGNVLINGQRPASKSDGLDTILSRIPASKVERIDVIRGGAPGIDMQGKTVIANVVLKPGGPIHGLLNLSDYHLGDGRDFGGARAEASGALVGDRTWEVALRGGGGPDDGVGSGVGSVKYASGKPPQQTRLAARGGSHSSAATAAIETPLLGGRLRVNGLVDQDRFEEPETDTIIAPVPEIQTFNYAQRTADTELGGRFTRNIGSDTSVELVGLRSTRRRTVDSTSEIEGSNSDFFNDRHSREAIGRAVLKRRFGQTVSLEAGAETADNQLTSRTRYLVDMVDQDVPAANVRVEERRSEVFLKGTWRPTAAWTVDGALRYETSDIASAGDVTVAKTLQFAKPRLTVSWTPTSATQVRARIERSVGQLNFSDFVASSNLTTSVGVTAGNPNLNPEQALVSELAVEQQLWAGATVLMTARHAKLADVVDRGPVTALDGTVFDRPTNIGPGSRDDLILDFTLPFNRFGWKGALLKGSVARRWSAVTDPTTGERREISGMHHNDWNATFSQDLPSQRANLGIDVYGGFQQRSYRFSQIETFKLQTVVKPYAEWKPGNGLSFRIELPLINSPKTRLRDSFAIFPGLRSAGGAPDIQDRAFHFPNGWYVRIRKDFG
jgi:outer membrane receptor protein involved in Fe transport